jgi:hypothetical protein
LLETVDGALDLVTLTINRPIKRALATHVAFLGDSEANTATAEQVAHRLATAPFVADDSLGTETGASPSCWLNGASREQWFDKLGFVALPGRQPQRHQLLDDKREVATWVI